MIEAVFFGLWIYFVMFDATGKIEAYHKEKYQEYETYFESRSGE